MKKKVLSVTGILVLIGIICYFILFSNENPSSTTPSVSKSGFYFDTIITVTLYDTTDSSYLDQCFSMASDYEHLFSTTISDSDVSKINASAGAAVTVDAQTIDLIQYGLNYSALSDGNFDITIGKLSSLWDFSNNTGTVPSASDIENAVNSINYQNVIVDTSANTVTLTDSDSQIDLGGIAKGYIADQMKSYLNSKGITDGIINLGGNVLTLGEKPDGSYYTIGIQKPFADDGEAIATIQIKDKTVVSSGIYERYFKVDDTLYHHILNPKTGYPYDNDLVGVTIICDHSVDGDGLSTTCFSLGLEGGMQLIESMDDVEAIFITKDDEIHTSSGIGTTIPFQKL